MQRFLLTTLGIACLAGLAALVGCSSKPADAPRQVEGPQGDPTPRPRPDDPVRPVPISDPQARAFDALVADSVQPTKQDQYDAAFREALDLVLDRHYNQALAALQKAQQADDNDLVRREIAKVTDLIAQQEAAEKTTRDVQTVLNDGKPDDAARLGNEALKQFGGGGDIADNLVEQKRQADTIVAAALPNDDERFTRFSKEGDDARTANNLRAAALAYEQALRFREDADVRRQYDAVQGALTRYDDARRRAATLRRDPAALEDALAALDEAKQAWDTPQVRQDVDDYNFALQRRRDRVSVATFEVRGDFGMRDAGRTVAEELLPHLKGRFDLVERAQVGRVLDELKVEANDLVASPDSQREVGRLARIRYLVVGSISPLNGVTINARLVNVQTGVVEQTARLSSPTFESLIPRLRVLGKVLQMDDAQKERFQEKLAAQPDQPVEQIQPIDLDRPVFAPPPMLVIDVKVPPPPPIIAFVARPRNFFVGVEIGSFRSLPLVAFDAPPPPPPAIEVVLARRDPRRGRLLALSVELGDDLFRRGRYREAQRHFSLALNLAGDNPDLALRLDRCRQAPPPPVVVVAAPPARPRLIVFSFMLGQLPGLVPPNLGDQASDQFAAYFGQNYEIVDRGEVCWYMGRLGITFRDVVNDPAARIAFAQAMNVRYYCFGTVLPTASLDVEAHLVDANSGGRIATGKIHVQDHAELKLRIGELAAQLGAPDAKAAQALAKRGDESEAALKEANTFLKAGKPAEAKAAAERGLTVAPDSAALRTVRDQADQQLSQLRIEEQRKTAEAARLRAQAEAKLAREKLARDAEMSRVKAEAEAKNRNEATVAAEKERRRKAALALQGEAKKASDAGYFVKAVSDLKSAAALDPLSVSKPQLDAAQARLDDANRRKVADEKKAADDKKAGDDKKAREAALVKIEQEKQRRAADEKIKQDARDKEVAGLLSAARKNLADKQYSKALAAAQAAQQLSRNAETDKLVADIQHEQTLASVKDDVASRSARHTAILDKARAAVAAKKYDEATSLLAEANKVIPDSPAAKSLSADIAKARGRVQEDYTLAMDAAKAALKKLDYTGAINAANVALGIIPNDPAATALLKDAQAGKARTDTDAKRKADYAAALQAGRAALAGKKYDDAVKDANAALKLYPGDKDALALLKAAETGKSGTTAEALKQAEYQRLMTAAQQAMAAKRYEDAAKSAADALKLIPMDATATRVLKDANDGIKADLVKKLQAEYSAAIQSAKNAVAAKKYDDAIKAANTALKIIPNDPAALALIKSAQDGMKSGLDAEAKRKADFASAMQVGKTALAAKRYDDAIKSAGDALKLFPGEPTATALLKDAQAGKVGADGEKKKIADYQAAILAGRAALAAKKFDDAIRDAQNALKLFPGDPTATGLLKDAQAGKATGDAEATRKAEYARQMTLGAQALATKRAADAIKAYTEALRLMPGDAAATKGLADARAADKPPPPPAPDYNKSMQSAQGFERQKAWADAAAAYRDALKAKPGDAKATFGLDLAEGQRALDAKKYADAQKWFEDALRLVPTDADAKALLKRAKDMK